jgi:hypothetical protein
VKNPEYFDSIRMDAVVDQVWEFRDASDSDNQPDRCVQFGVRFDSVECELCLIPEVTPESGLLPIVPPGDADQIAVGFESQNEWPRHISASIRALTSAHVTNPDGSASAAASRVWI